jgi:hypothetical protein
MVFMTFSRAHCTFVPFFFVLLQSKKEDAYFYAIQSVISATSWKIDACTITYDFETSLMKAMKNQFRNAYEVGCFFHWKQALLKKLTKLKLPDSVVYQLIGHEEGLLNLLTVVPIEEILTKAIPYIDAKINQPGLLDSFWSYFINTWMKKYHPTSWNINHIPSGKEEDVLINRTNCPLERFNRTLNKELGEHPNMPTFVNGLASLSVSIVRDLDNIQKGRKPTPALSQPHIHSLPADYATFRAKTK